MPHLKTLALVLSLLGPLATFVPLFLPPAPPTITIAVRGPVNAPITVLVAPR